MKDSDDQMKYPTLKDVAKKAGVSPITVSRVFNESWKGRVKEETFIKVLDVANKLNYSPNGLAKSLNGERTNIIAVVTGSKTGVFYDEIMHKLTYKIQKSGRQALVFVADYDHGMERIVRQVSQYRVDGIIITSPATKSGAVDFFENLKIPVVLFNRRIQSSSASAVWSEGALAMKKLAHFLYENDLTQIAFVDGFGEEERNASFIEALTEKQMSLMDFVSGDYTYESGIEAGIKILSKETRPNVIVCGSDNMALGVIDAARLKFNLKVPEDVSVVGFDDNVTARLKAYDLTTIRQPVDEMISFTFEIIDDLMKFPEKQILRSFETELIIRGSVRLKK